MVSKVLVADAGAAGRRLKRLMTGSLVTMPESPWAVRRIWLLTPPPCGGSCNKAGLYSRISRSRDGQLAVLFNIERCQSAAASRPVREKT